MWIIARWHRSFQRRGFCGALAHIPVVAMRPLLIALRKWRTRRKIVAWLRSHEGALNVHIACGHDHKDGWLNTDLYFSPWCVDALEPLPFPDHSIDYLYSQHFVEHFTRAQACFHFRECRRVLRPEGVLRISTPDLAQAVSHYLRSHGEASDGILQSLADAECDGQPITPCQYLNDVMRSHDHLHIFDFEDLQAVLHEAGFAQVERVPYGHSEDQHLCGLETRYQSSGESAQSLGLFVEARGSL